MSPAAFSSEPRSIYPSLWVPKMMMDREQAWLLLSPLGKHLEANMNLAMVLGREGALARRGADAWAGAGGGIGSIGASSRSISELSDAISFAAGSAALSLRPAQAGHVRGVLCLFLGRLLARGCLLLGCGSEGKEGTDQGRRDLGKRLFQNTTATLHGRGDTKPSQTEETSRLLRLAGQLLHLASQPACFRPAAGSLTKVRQDNHICAVGRASVAELASLCPADGC